MMVLFGDGRKSAATKCWNVVAIIFAVLLLAGLLAVNIAGQGYEQQFYLSSAYNQSSSSFPADFLGGSLKETLGCESQLLRQGDGKSLFPTEC
jgi:hypothetical protein